ncbi:putative carboxylesterase [Rosa chinensis]|uniref:Putative carboxylesterase n=1 Tax=Rosa chinensis TaxID=74649 RepID=A0A2P6RYH6_ROSCH|nr:GDSL esterase/lipase 1 isoform X1 [Rosa chinensis]XP_024184940.1 GDSL esterase/lipase 1 isoform X2 [Rosa chinensis]PRQ51488.1 putative carboxylesterase [Rosa chinensis]
MASLGYIVYALASLFNPVSFFLYGHHSQYTGGSNSSTEHDDQFKVALFVFGDSLFEAGNNGYLPNVTTELDAAIAPPYGETFFHYPTGRFSDGRIVPDFIAKYAKLPMLPPYLQPGPHDFTDGCNFASAGAGVLVQTNPGRSISLPAQLSFFKDVRKSLQQKLGDLKAKRVLREAVYLIGIGGDDYFDFYNDFPNATESLQLEAVAVVVGNLSIILQDIYDLGGRKFAFQNAGPLGCIPYRRQEHNSIEGCVEGLNSLARLHNTALVATLEELESQLLGFKYSIFDYYNSLDDRLRNPAKYGFTNATDACCGTGLFRAAYCGGDNGTKPYELCNNVGDYLWFDGSHTTEIANIPIAELIWSGTPNVTGPYNVKQLFQQVSAY